MIPLPTSLLYRTLDQSQTAALLADIVAVIRAAPLYRPVMPRSGKPFSVLMTNCGPLGWVSDREGYRYQAQHPVTGGPWPPIPPMLLALWDELADYPHEPQACLVNYYGQSTRMGLHQDRDEEDFSAPVLSVSLGDTARFRLGGTDRKDPTQSFLLRSGDVMLLAGDRRLAYHGVDRVLTGSSRLLEAHPDLFPDGGRINLTMRRVTKPR
ncbi:alpha-ketoglutarate-dependent dioxygenase AlkB family protein [Devosia nitrariae]|uniref:Alkylated DNA repair dioxygenase n=1 Tax=Devosia nitrariae TaxID=2071872 RepID=A0ABQ5WDG1_9HYPH|nr:alpha-ketoglutarate-dependent dioxygenase AlkB [Devosia nitrariae]GLQ58175.1 alkylated DNA repair dioxygenase [Devosia nitrariae]